MPVVTEDSPQGVKDHLCTLLRRELYTTREHTELFHQINNYKWDIGVCEELRKAVMLEF